MSSDDEDAALAHQQELEQEYRYERTQETDGS